MVAWLNTPPEMSRSTRKWGTCSEGFDWLIISSFNSLSQLHGLYSVELEDGHEYG